MLGKGDQDRDLLTLLHERATALRAWIEVCGEGDRLTATSVSGSSASGPWGPPRAIAAVLDLIGGDVRAAQRLSRHLDLRTHTVYNDNREDLAGRMARLVAAAL